MCVYNVWSGMVLVKLRGVLWSSARVAIVGIDVVYMVGGEVGCGFAVVASARGVNTFG